MPCNLLLLLPNWPFDPLIFIPIIPKFYLPSKLSLDWSVLQIGAILMIGFFQQQCQLISLITREMYFEDDLDLPALIPVKVNRKKKNEDEEKDRDFTEEDAINAFTQEFIKQQEDKHDVKKPEKEKPKIGPEKIEEFDRKFSNLHQNNNKKEEKGKKVQNHKDHQNQHSKFMIAEMMKKINAKNITEELSPVTNQTIFDLIKRMDWEVDELKVEAERKENSLITNPNNQHLKKELEALKVSIDRCVTIKELYNEKINLRNKVSVLQRNIIHLKEENQNLKIKISRGLEDAQNHAQGLPCQKEKELKDQLNKCQVELKKEKGIRQKLEGNISDIVLNFKRLYEEADTARIIVTRKLKEIQEKQKNMVEAVEEISQPSMSDRKMSPQLEALQERRLRVPPQNIKSSQNNDTSNVQQRTPMKQNSHNVSGASETKVKQMEHEKMIKNTKGKFSLQESIRKMQANQKTIAKNR